MANCVACSSASVCPGATSRADGVAAQRGRARARTRRSSACSGGCGPAPGAPAPVGSRRRAVRAGASGDAHAVQADLGVREPAGALVAHHRQPADVLDARRVGRTGSASRRARARLPSGSVTAMTIIQSAPSKPVVNHLWPSITKAVAVGGRQPGGRGHDGRVGAGVLGLGHGEARPGTSPSSSGLRESARFCASVAKASSSSALPMSGACPLVAQWPSGLQPNASRDAPVVGQRQARRRRGRCCSARFHSPARFARARAVAHRAPPARRSRGSAAPSSGTHRRRRSRGRGRGGRSRCDVERGTCERQAYESGRWRRRTFNLQRGASHHQPTNCPPSMRKRAPVTNDDASLAR